MMKRNKPQTYNKMKTIHKRHNNKHHLEKWNRKYKKRNGKPKCIRRKELGRKQEGNVKDIGSTWKGNRKGIERNGEEMGRA